MKFPIPNQSHSLSVSPRPSLMERTFNYIASVTFCKGKGRCSQKATVLYDANCGTFLAIRRNQTHTYIVICGQTVTKRTAMCFRYIVFTVLDQGLDEDSLLGHVVIDLGNLDIENGYHGAFTLSDMVRDFPASSWQCLEGYLAVGAFRAGGLQP